MAEIQKYRHVSLAVINKKAFWNSYDHLGRLMLLNLAAIIAALTVIGLPLAIMGLFAMTVKVVNYEELELRQLWPTLRPFLKRGYLLVGLLLLGVAILVANLYFYNSLLNRGTDPAGLRFLFSAMQGLMLWLLLFLSILAYFIFPVLCQMNRGVKATLKNSLFLMFNNLKVAFYLLISVLFWLIVGFFTGIGLVFLTFSMVSVIGNTAIRETLAQYREAGLDPAEEARELRDLIKPWR